MTCIFIGILFLLIDFTPGSVSVTPAFVGYLLIGWGMRQMPHVSSFANGTKITLFGAVCTGLIWLRSFFQPEFDMIALFCMVFSMCLQLFVLRMLVQGAVEIQTGRGIFLHAQGLVNSWNIMAISGAGMCLLRFFLYAFAQACLLLYVGSEVAFAVLYFQAGRACRAMEAG